MGIRELFATSFQAMGSHKLRSGLTLLGVIIGVMTVVAVVSVISGLNAFVATNLVNLNPDVLVFTKFGILRSRSEFLLANRRKPLTMLECRLVEANCRSCAAVGAQADQSAAVKAGRRKLGGVEITGYTANADSMLNLDLESGRFFNPSEEEHSAAVAVIGADVKDEIFPGLDPIGRRVKAFGVPLTVIGVYAEASSLFSSSNFPILIMPHETFTKVADYQKGWLTLFVRPTDSATVQEAEDQVITALRSRRGLKPAQENNFAVVTQDKLMETYKKVTGGFFLVMLALSSIGLMVGGIGVIAIMMISVTERTREIGVRKALGATRREIMFQFLVEAATLTVLGGVIGMLLGGLLAFLVNHFSPIPAAVPLWSVVAAIVASAVTGIFFGLYPASRAARLDPVEALRYE